jgi:chemotaxis protein histidine kinase CheA
MKTPRRKNPEPPDDDSGEQPGDGEMPPTQRHATGADTDNIIPVKPPEDDILDVLSDFETGLESLKALYVQRQKLQTRIRDQEEQVKKRETALSQRAGEVERATQEQQRRAAELEQARAELEKREQEIAQGASDRAKSLEEQARKLAKDTEALGHLTSSMEGKSKELDAARASLKKDHEAYQQERAQLSKQLEQAKQEAQKYAQHAMKLESGMDSKLEEAVAARDKAAAELADLQAKWTQEKSQAAKLTAALSQHQTDTAETDKALTDLRTRYQEEVGSRDQLRKQLESAEQSVNKANARAEALQTKLTALAAEVAAFKEKAGRQPEAPKQLVSSSTASMLRRRQRLKVYRELVREQAIKVRKASDAIKKKVETCEQILAQRSELATIRDRVLEGERRLQRRHAGSRAAVTLTCVVAVFAVLAAMSWVLAREVAPATYMATSVLKADGRSRTLNRAELDEWTHFHQALLTDPRFHETAADRFKRTGFPKLSSPEAIAELVRNDLTTENATPGEMQLHLKGLGSDKTQRTLETFTAALATQANAMQQARIDGAVTAVSMPASAADEPLDNTRMMYFVGILMVGITICLVFVMSLWKRLVGAKTAFEQDDVVNQALDDSKWAAFTAAAAAQQGSAAAIRNKTARG